MTKLSIREKIELRKNLKQRSPAENVELFYKRCMSAQELLDEATNTIDNEDDDGEKNHSETFRRDVLLNFVLGLENSLQEQILASDAFDLDSFYIEAIKAEKHQLRKFSSNNSVENFQIKDEPESHQEDYQKEEDVDDEFLVNVKDTIENFESILDHQANNNNIGSGFVYNFQDGSEEKFSDQNHIKNHDAQQFPCDRCQLVFSKSKKLALHQAVEHRTVQDKYMCTVCSKEFKDKERLKKHMYTQHLNDKPFKCNVCEKRFTYQSHLEHHTRTAHLCEKPFVCDVCEKAYTNKSGLVFHQRVAHSDTYQHYKCPQCPKMFKYKGTIPKHIAVFHSNETCVCDQCGLSFKHKDKLRIHRVQVHTENGGKNIPCTDCDMKFRLKSHMRSHYKSKHLDERNHPCTYCEKTFKVAKNLREHIHSVHLDHKPYACNQCDFRTAYKGHLPEHVKVKHEKIYITCPYCPHQSGYKGNLDKHIRNVHNKLTE